MTKEEAISLLAQINKIIVNSNSWLKSTHEPLNTAFTMAIEALKQEPCEDCISRQAVLEIAKSSKSNWIDNSVLFKRVNNLPSVTQQQKIGHWRDTGSGQECSECGEIQYGYDSFRQFCANCGARMEETE